PYRLMQIVNNLVSNALKFTARGKIIVVVKGEPAPAADASAERCALHISVTDSGIGIAPAAQHRIFEAFTQADTSTTRRFGGTGLGLSICRQLAALMGGRVWLESEVGVGSTFHVVVDVGVATAEQVEECAQIAVDAGEAVDSIRPVATANALSILLAE